MINLICSLKGGTGKSTLTFNLAVWLKLADINVKLLDLDPQATLTDVVEVRGEDKTEPILSVLDKKALVKKSLKSFKGEVLIDVGTADMDSLKKAISYCDRIIIPVPPSQADIWSTQRFMRIVRDVKKTDDEPLPEVYAFVNRADTHRAIRESDEAASALVSLKDIKFIKQRLAARTPFRRSFSEGLAVFELDSRSKAAKEFNDLAARLFRHVII